MVNLGYHRKAALGHAGYIVEPFDNGEFPWRTLQIERAGKYACRLDTQLAPVARLRQCDVAHVKLQIEVRVLDPVRIVQVERHPHQPLADCAAKLHPAFEEIQDILEPDKAARRGRRVVDKDRTDMHRRIARFHRDKRRIHTLQLAQGLSPVFQRCSRLLCCRR